MIIIIAIAIAIAAAAVVVVVIDDADLICNALSFNLLKVDVYGNED